MVLPAGHGGDYKVPKCSEVKLDAITTDDTGKTYFFAGKVANTKIIFLKVIFQSSYLEKTVWFNEEINTSLSVFKAGSYRQQVISLA